MNAILVSSIKLLLLLPLSIESADDSTSVVPLSRPKTQENFMLHIPSHLIRISGEDNVQQSFPVSQCIAGSRVRGSGNLTGNYQQQLIGSNQSALWDIDFQGTSFSRTRATQQRVTVRQHGTLNFESNGKVRFDFSGFRTGKVSTSGKLRTRTTSTYTPFKGLRRRIALRRVRNQSGSNRRIAERIGLRDVSNSFRRELQSAVSKMNRDYQREVITPLVKNDIYPIRTSVVSHNKAVQVALCFAPSAQNRFTTPREEFYAGKQLRLAVHQDAVNYTSKPLAGKSKSLSATLQNVVSGDQDAEGSESDLRIKFAEHSPFVVSFADETLTVTLSAEGFERAGQAYGGMEISFAYRSEVEQDEQVLVLAGQPLVQRPTDEAGKRPKLGLRDLSLRRILVNVLKRDLPERIAVSELELPIPSSLFQPLSPTSLHCENGWLFIEADRKLARTVKKSKVELKLTPASLVE